VGLLDGRVVMVSGVGPGLGRATAAAVLREGASVVLGDLDTVRLETIRHELDPDGGHSSAIGLDITQDPDCNAIVEAARERFGRLDGVVHVAALDTVEGGLLESGFDDWDRAADVNVKGTLRLTRASVPPLRERGGSVVVIGTVGAIRPRRETLRFAYGASKGALLTAARYLALELGRDAIRVNTVAPGWKWGPVLEGWAHDEAERRGVTLDEIVAELASETALRRLATDADVANAVVFLLSDLAAAITGQLLVVDGGGYYH